MSIYLVKHAHEVGDPDHDVRETKIIGIFSSELKAKAAIDLLKDRPGFADYPDDFIIEDYEIDDVEWDRGFIKGFGESRLAQQPTEFTPAGDYAGFMSGLMGVEDDATMAGYSKEGCDLLRRAIRVFGTEFDERHPDHG